MFMRVERRPERRYSLVKKGENRTGGQGVAGSNPVIPTNLFTFDALAERYIEYHAKPHKRTAADLSPLRRRQRRPFDTGTTVKPSWRAASARRSSNTTKGRGSLISRWR